MASNFTEKHANETNPLKLNLPYIGKKNDDDDDDDCEIRNSAKQISIS